MGVLPIFPEGGLASSVITTVWVGVWVLCLFNLRFGWVLSGLVVPGYLVPLIIVKPVSALVIVLEAVLAYALVWLFSEKLSRGRFPSLFGRDRFMGLILASIAVRLLFDGWLLPVAADWLSANWNRQVHWQSDLQSFGLVIISLLANQFWKPGLKRGMVAFVITTGLTWLIVRYGLMELTNFHIGGVTYLYEGLASSVLASPKAYIILVLTALYASHMNVRFGWDFSGILIPALIALQWYEPSKILTSFAEAIVIFVVARQLLKTRWLANATIEGANKVLLFFNISFVLKLVVGWALLWLGWNVKTTDFYGFGYLLSTLLAMKAHDKDIFPRLMRSTLQVSFVGAGVGNLVGFVLALLVPAGMAGAARQGEAVRGQAREDALLVAAVGDAHWRTAAPAEASLSARSAAGLGDALELLGAGLPPVQAGAVAAAGGWRVEMLANSRVALVREDGSGRDLVLYDAAAPRDLALRVADASIPGQGEAARALMARLGARWLLVTAPGAPGGVGASVDAVFAAKVPAAQLILAAPPTAAAPRLALAGGGAQAVDVEALRRLYPGLAVSFAAERDAADASRLSLPPALAPGAVAPSAAGLENEGAACTWRREARAASRLQSREELLFLQREVVLPLLGGTPAGAVLAASGARALGLALTRCTAAGRAVIMLARPEGGDGVFLVDPAGDASLIVTGAVRREQRGRRDAAPLAADALAEAALRIGTAGRAGLVALAERELDYDGSQATAFGLVTQTALARLGNSPGLVVQLRPRPQFGSRLAGDKAILLPDRLGASAARIAQWQGLLEKAGFAPLVVQRTREFAGYEAYPLASLRVLNHSFEKRYLVVYPPMETP